MPTNPMAAHAAPRCAAKSKRTHCRCKAPAMRGKRVCRAHGALAGTPRGSAHGQYKHDQLACEALAARRVVRELIREAREAMDNPI